MANSTPAWHDIFRYIKLMPDNVTLMADTYKDTLTIMRNNGVSFGSNVATDTFEINVNYDISIPVSTTDITLEDVNGNTSSITFTAGRGVEIVRNSAQEFEWRSYSVTETDTLQTVTERNNITNNKIFVNDIEVGTISSSFGEDGFPSYDAGHDLAGNGTLDDPLVFSPRYKDSLAATSSDQFKFTATGPGTLSYSAAYILDIGAASASVTLEREDPSSPGTWVVLDIQSGTTLGYSYSIQGIYSELYNGNVNYRLTFAWNTNAGVITWEVQNTFEGGATSPISYPQLKTDTTAKTVDINDFQFIQNTIRTTVSNTDIVLDPAGTGKVRVLGDLEIQNLQVDGNITIGDGVGTDVVTFNAQFFAGTQLKTSQTNGNTLNISAYDVNDAVYRDLIILTASNTPTLVLTSNGVGSIDNMTIGQSTAAAGTFTSLTATGAITHNTTTNNQSYTTTGAGTITITSGTTGSMNNITIGNSTAAAGTFTDLTATGAITHNTTTNNQSYTTTGAGTITITSGTVGNINNMNIGASTRGTGAFTSLDANGNVTLGDADTDTITVGGSFVNGTVLRSSKTNADTLAIAAYDVNDAVYRNLITLTASNTPTIAITSNGVGTLDNITIGGTTAAAGTFTQIVRSGNVSASAWGTTGVGIRTAGGIFTDTSTANGGTATNAHINVLSQPTIASTGTTVTVTNAATLYIANAPTNGTNVSSITNPYALYVAAGAVYFAGAGTMNSSLTVNGNLTASGSSATVTLSPTGTGGVVISPSGSNSVTINPTTGGSIDNMNVGASTRGSGAFTTLTANNTTTLQQITEVLNTKTGATGVVTHDYSTGDIFYHSSIAANFTVNLTNVPTTNDRTIVVTLILNQGVAGYYPSAIQIAGVAQTLRWANNVTPTPSASKIDVAVFTLIRTGSTWYVLGNYTVYN